MNYPKSHVSADEELDFSFRSSSPISRISAESMLEENEKTSTASKVTIATPKAGYSRDRNHSISTAESTSRSESFLFSDQRFSGTSGRRPRLKLNDNSGTKMSFAVKSIRHGSDEWYRVLKPFVSDLAFRSLEYRWYQSDVSFCPYTCYAAVLFIDLCNYSGITAAIAHKGAHALSNIVNAYFSKLLKVVQEHGGDVVKFAGDAVLVVWEGETQDFLRINVLTAAKCALELQNRQGSYPVDGTDFCFRLHCGLACGALESEIYAAPSAIHMQRLYHSVGGESLVELNELVDLAKPGEVCVSDECKRLIGERGTHELVEGIDSKGFDTCGNILKSITYESALLDDIDDHIANSLTDRILRRNRKIEEEFIHPSVIRLLSHGGLSPTQIAQMRYLCVLFIAMTSNGSTVNWLLEVQSILDKNRCPIVQIIDDDKGVHVVAAVNLYESVPETSLMGLSVCFDLVAKQVGCAIGMAQGPSFCGVTGCPIAACRWDITGPPAVRAARLMEYALTKNVEVAIDQSVYNDPTAAIRMAVLEENVVLKGTKESIMVYSISGSSNSAAFRVLETVHAHVHDDVVKKIEEHILHAGKRCAAICTGIPLAGKKIVCQRAAGFANLVPYLHVSDDSAGFVQLARTIATWFSYADNDVIRKVAEMVLDRLQKNQWSRAHDTCINLVDLALEEGLRACFIIDRMQFLDDFSISLLRECLFGTSGSRMRRQSSHHSDTSTTGIDDTEPELECPRTSPKICFLGVHVTLYHCKPASYVVKDITRMHPMLQVPVFKVESATHTELQEMLSSLVDIKVDDRCVDIFGQASGSYAGYIIEKASGMRKLSGTMWREGKKGYTQINENLVLTVPFGQAKKFKEFPIRNVNGEVAMKFSQIFDGLPPLFQLFCKILAVLTKSCSCFNCVPRVVLWEVLNDIVAEGVEDEDFNVIVSELNKMGLVKTSPGQEDFIFLTCPALADIAMDVSTPVQIKAIAGALIGRLETSMLNNFRILIAVAYLHLLVGDSEKIAEKLLLQGFEAFKIESQSWKDEERLKWSEAILDDIRDSGIDSVKQLMKEEIEIPLSNIGPGIDDRHQRFKMYMAPIAFGPMGHTLSVICRNLFHSYGDFHGYSAETIAKKRSASASAHERYCLEVKCVEDFLSGHGFAATADAIQHEIQMISDIAGNSLDENDILRKVSVFLDQYIPSYVETRLKRLHLLVNKLRCGEIPDVIRTAEKSLQRAYSALRTSRQKQDAAQDALMVLATSNWKPRPVPEFLPLIHYQTVARIRNKVLKRLTLMELFIFKHQQTELDLEAFLLTTALLYKAQDSGLIKILHVN